MEGISAGSMPEMKIFSAEDIRQAAAAINFDKAIGPDGFDGCILGLNEQLDAKVFTTSRTR